MKTLRTDYTFDASAQTVTFADPIGKEGLLLVTNVTDGIIIYNFADPTKGGAITSNILTLEFNTTEMDDTDDLQVFWDNGVNSAVDNTQLFSGNITTIGAGSAITMTGYHSASIQLSGAWVGVIYFESSNDNSVWDTVLIHSRDDVALQDMVDQNGLYSVRSSGKYLRYNVSNITGTMTAVILGKTTDALSPADKLSFAMDKQLNMPLFVEQSNPERRDLNNAQVLSDAPNPISWTSSNVLNKPIIIDTAGYNAVVIQKTTAGIIVPTVSNDGVTWYATMGYLSSTPFAPAANMPAALGVYVYPVTGRYFMLTGPATQVNCLIYLRNIPLTQQVTNNFAYLAGSNIVTGGLAGVLSVGGNVSTGTAPTTNPVQIGGVDAGRLNTPGAVAAGLTPKTRRALTDEQGRFIPPQVDPLVSLNFENVMAAMTRDTSQHEGQSIIEILYHILIELRTLNHQIHELPISIGAGTMNPCDDLSDIRTEMKRFNYDD